MASMLDKSIFDLESFTRILEIERRRTDRSRRPFLLMLIDLKKLLQGDKQQKDRFIKNMVKSLQRCIRQTDMMGWYQNHTIIGIIFTELYSETPAIGKIRERVNRELQGALTPQQFETIGISTYLYPSAGPIWSEPESSNKFYLDSKRHKLSAFIKRGLDIILSLLLVILLSPVFILIGIAIKLTSKGPILYKQKRVGQFGQQFTFLKFRSMYTNNDPRIHQQYIEQFISQSKNGSAAQEALKQEGLYKLHHDPRVTPLGNILRKTSLDELPQFFNVIMGTMSLVGPRPPIPYEIEHYDLWHKRRVLEVKPGITGLWQVKGRSRTTFDEMVRLDLQYIDNRCLWTDLKLLLKTPWSVIKGDGAR